MTREQTLQGGGLRITFTRLVDRFAHAVALVDDDGVKPLLESIEGSAHDPWPPSPPLQDLHIEQRPGGVRVALLVGRAGLAHWSASVALDPGAGNVEFDIACRASGSPNEIASRYRLAADLAAHDATTIHWLGASSASLEACPVGGSRGSIVLKHADRCFDIVPNPPLAALPPGARPPPGAPPPRPGPVTVRWRYVISRPLG